MITIKLYEDNKQFIIRVMGGSDMDAQFSFDAHESAKQWVKERGGFVADGWRTDSLGLRFSMGAISSMTVLVPTTAKTLDLWDLPMLGTISALIKKEDADNRFHIIKVFKTNTGKPQ